jgi:hypothetical protein
MRESSLRNIICVNVMPKYLAKKLVNSSTQNWVTPNICGSIIH